MWGRARQCKKDSGKQQRVGKVVDALDLEFGARLRQRANQDGSIDDKHQQHKPTANTGCHRACFPAQQNASPSDEEGGAGHVVDERAPGNPQGHLFFERDSRKTERMKKVFNTKNDDGDRNQYAPDS